MLTVYTDGSASPNPGPGGAGAVIIRDDKVIGELIHTGPNKTTNNRMELTALILAFPLLPRSEPVTIYTDSEYVKKGINEWIHNWVKRGWKTAGGSPVKNDDLWRKLWKYCQDYSNVKIEWIKAHNGHKWNEKADELANIGTSRSKNLGSI